MKEVAYAALYRLLAVDVPELLQLCARSLSGAPIPKTLDAWAALDRADWFQLAPICGSLLVLCAVPLWAAAQSRRHDGAAARRDGAKDTYWLTRIVLLRGMGLIYLAAFLTSATQSRAMFGEHGLSPAISDPSGRPQPAFGLLERIGLPRGDLALEVVSWAGVLLASLLTVGDRCFVTWAPLPLALWLLYLSLVNTGARAIIGYGWEWETLEIGFLMIFLCPEWPARTPFPRALPPPHAVLWLLRWSTFRLLIGAGMSKLGQRSSACWHELSCTETHYFTQPMPNFLSWFMHRLPARVHRIEVALTFFEQLVLPFLVLIPLRPLRILSCCLALFFQVCVVGTGNYAWINWIGALPVIALLDDHALMRFFPAKLADETMIADAEAATWSTVVRPNRMLYRSYRKMLHAGLFFFILCKSAAPLKELFGPAPWLAFYDDFFFVNAQGVFGFINKHRVNIVMEYTHEALPTARKSVTCADSVGKVAHDANGNAFTCAQLRPHCAQANFAQICPKTCGKCSPNERPWDDQFESLNWQPLDFKNLPGDPYRRPKLNSPYHYRLVRCMK